MRSAHSQLRGSLWCGNDSRTGRALWTVARLRCYALQGKVQPDSAAEGLQAAGLMIMGREHAGRE